MAEPHYLPNGALADPVVLMDPTTGAAYAASGGGSGGGGAVTLADGAATNIGTSTDTAASLSLLGRLLKLIGLLPASLGPKTAATSLSVTLASDQATAAAPLRTDPTGSTTQPVSGTVTTNVGTGTRPISVVDGGNTALGSTGDTASTNSAMGYLKAIKAALQGTLATNATIVGTPNVNVTDFPSTQAVSGSGNFAITAADGADTALGTTTDLATANTLIGRVKNLLTRIPTALGQQTSAASLGVVLASDQSAVPVSGTLAAVTAITNPLPAGTNTVGAVKQAAQASLTAVLATNVTTVTNTTGQSLDGYDGAATIELVAQGTGTQAVSLQIEGSLDNTNWYIVGTAQIDATANPTYAAANFTLTLAGGVTVRHLYALRDTVKFVRITTTANNLATGLSSTLYTNPV